jgi:hypothetical protein
MNGMDHNFWTLFRRRRLFPLAVTPAIYSLHFSQVIELHVRRWTGVQKRLPWSTGPLCTCQEVEKIYQDVHKYFASAVSGMNMVILKQYALNGLLSPLEYSQVQQEMV